MRRKCWQIISIAVGSLSFLVVILVVATPLWVRLGIKPVCVQGDWPHLSVATCPVAQSEITPMPLPKMNELGPIPIIVDDDGSPDGMIALLYFLNNPLFDVRAVTISCGEAHPSVFAAHAQQLLAGLGKRNIPVGAGREIPLDGDNAFPEPWRQASDEFWGITLPNGPVATESIPAAQLIVDTVKNSPQPVMVFVSGTHTNLAEALRLDGSIAGNIREVFIMGGSVYVPGNIHNDWPSLDNTVAEWNIWVDPLAADEVFSSGLLLHVVPLDATRRVVWSSSDLAAWQASPALESGMASSLLQWMLDSWSPQGVYVWDLVTATLATNPALCKEISMGLDVITAQGPDQGRTVESDSQNVSVCLDPDSGQVKALAEIIFKGD